MQAPDSPEQSLPISLQHSIDLAQESGASSWLTSLPIQEFGFALHKGAFQDALALRYNWLPLRTIGVGTGVGAPGACAPHVL